MKDLSFYLRRILFIGAISLAGLAILEKLINIFGYTLLRAQYTPWRLLEFSAIALLFLVSLQLREINMTLVKGASKGEPRIDRLVQEES